MGGGEWETQIHLSHDASPEHSPPWAQDACTSGERTSERGVGGGVKGSRAGVEVGGELGNGSGLGLANGLRLGLANGVVNGEGARNWAGGAGIGIRRVRMRAKGCVCGQGFGAAPWGTLRKPPPALLTLVCGGGPPPKAWAFVELSEQLFKVRRMAQACKERRNQRRCREEE